MFGYHKYSVKIPSCVLSGKRQSSGGGSGMPNYNANTVNKLISSMTDPSQSQLGPGGATGGMYNPDTWNTISFNLFNPQNQLGKRCNLNLCIKVLLFK